MAKFIGPGASVLLLTLWIKHSTSLLGFNLFEVVISPYAQSLHLLNLEPKGPISLTLNGVFFPPLLAAFAIAVFVASPILNLVLCSSFLRNRGEQSRREFVALYLMSCMSFLGVCLVGYFAVIPWTLFALGRWFDQDIARIGWSQYLGISIGLTVGLGALSEVAVFRILTRKSERRRP